MSLLGIIAHDAEDVLAEVLAEYVRLGGDELAAADPRRLILASACYGIAQARAVANYGANQSLIDYLSFESVAPLGALWGSQGAPLAATPSTCTVRFTFSTSPVGGNTVPAGKRVGNGTYVWAVKTDTTGAPSTNYTDAVVEQVLAGSGGVSGGASSNGITAGLITTLIDPFGTCTAVSNTTTTANGRNVETIDEWRIRIKTVPDSIAVAGPRAAYVALAKAADTRVHTAAAFGPDDVGDMVGSTIPGDGEVVVLVTQAARDGDGAVTEAIPEPDADLLTAVSDYLTAEERRPLGDSVTVAEPTWNNFNITLTYYIAESRAGESSTIQAAVDDAIEEYAIWQQQIGRNLIPSKLHQLLLNAGAQVADITEPTWSQIAADCCPRLLYTSVTFGGIDDD